MMPWLLQIADAWWAWTLLCLPGAILVFIVAELLLRGVRGMSVALRYAVLLIVLVKFVMPAPWSLPVPVPWSQTGLSADSGWTETDREPLADNTLASPEIVVGSKEKRIAEPGVVSAVAPQRLAEVPFESRPSSKLASSAPHLPVAVAAPTYTSLLADLSTPRILFLTFSAGLLVVGGWMFLKILHLALITRTARRDEELAALCARLAVRMEMRMPVVLVSDAVSGPLAGGLYTTFILAPETLLERSHDEKQLLLAHELGHLKRRDHIVNWLQIIIGAVCWWNPLVARLNHRIRCEREHCCDDLVVRLLPEKVERYPEILLDVAEHQVRSRQHILASAFAYPKHALTERIRRLTMKRSSTHKNAVVSVGVVAVFCVSMLVGVYASESAADANKEKLGELLTKLQALVADINRAYESDAELTSEELSVITSDMRDALGVVDDETAPPAVMGGFGMMGGYGTGMGMGGSGGGGMHGATAGGDGQPMPGMVGGMGSMGMGGMGMGMGGMGMMGMGMMGPGMDGPVGWTIPGSATRSEQQLPDLLKVRRLKLLDGTEVDLGRTQRDEVLILYFWATWCPPCWKQLPVVQELYDRYKDLGLAAYAVSIEGDKTGVRRYLEEKGLTVPAAVESGHDFFMAFVPYTMGRMPVAVILEKNHIEGIYNEDPQAFRAQLERKITHSRLMIGVSTTDHPELAAAHVGLVQSQLKETARALENFFVDAGMYPMPVDGRTLDRAAAKMGKGRERRLSNLVWPVYYLSRFTPDPFDPEGKPCRYFSDGDKWVLVSNGPDMKPDYDERTYLGESLETLGDYLYQPDERADGSGDIILVGGEVQGQPRDGGAGAGR